MSFTATQYLFKASVPTSTVTATVGAYTVPAATKASVIALTVSNVATTNQTTYADIDLYDGTTAYRLVTKLPLYPGGSEIVEGVQKHVLPTGGAVLVTAYATLVSAILTAVEIT